jgi:zinc transport system ATP-binding protein
MGRRPFYNKEEKNLAKENMKKMGISEFSKRCYRELSGGQQQRVLLARALCATQKMLLLDEPVSGLDPIVTEEMYNLIQSLNKDGITIIMISHDVLAAIKYATHILHIGKEIFFGTKDEYMNSSVFKKFGGV